MMRLHPLCIIGITILSIIAEKCGLLVGVGDETYLKRRTERFSLINCLDMSYGTIACVSKECVKLYLYYIRAVHVDKARTGAKEAALEEEMSKGRSLKEAFKKASEEGNAAARTASRQAKHIMGELLSSGWDMFETIYFGGTPVEGLVRGTGTFLGAYNGGMIGEGRLGWLGFVVGSQMGSWVGGRLGLLAYDLAGNGLQYLLNSPCMQAPREIKATPINL